MMNRNMTLWLAEKDLSIGIRQHTAAIKGKRKPEKPQSAMFHLRRTAEELVRK